MDGHTGTGPIRRNGQPVRVPVNAYAGAGPEGQIRLPVPVMMMSGACRTVQRRLFDAPVEGGIKLIDRMMIVFTRRVPLMLQFVQGLHGGRR